MVYARRHDDRILTFIVSGRLWRDSLIMQDKETGTFWSHVTGEALLGSLTGASLESIPSVQTSWAEWFREHPDTKLLRKSRMVRSSVYESYFRNEKRMGLGLMRGSWAHNRMPGKTIIHGVAIGPHTAAIADTWLRENQMENLLLGEEPVVVMRGDDGGVRAWKAKSGSYERLTFQKTSDDHYIDDQTGSTWSLEEGRCVTGQLEGIHLESVQVTTAFWFAWSSFYPNTQVID